MTNAMKMKSSSIEEEIKERITKSLVTNLTSISSQSSLSALSELRHLSKTDPTFRPIIASLDGGCVISHLSEFLFSTTATTQDHAAATLLNLSISVKQPLVSTRCLLHSLSHALSCHRDDYSPSAVQSVAAVIYSLSVIPSFCENVGKNRDVIYYLVDIVSWLNSPLRSVKDALKALFGLSVCTENREVILSLDGVAALFRRAAVNGGGLLEDVTAVIAQVAGCYGAPVEFRSVGGVRVLVNLIDLGVKATIRVRENAVSALVKLVEFGGETVAEEIREVGLGLIFDGLGEVIHCGSEKGKIRAQDLMRVLESGMSRSSSSTGSNFGSGPLGSSRSSY